MVFVPVPYTPPQPSPRVKDLSDQLAKVIRDYEQRFPNLSAAEVRQAAQLAVQNRGSGSAATRQAIAMGIGLATFLAGLWVFLTRQGTLAEMEIPWMLVAVGGVAVIGLLVFLLRRGE
jgi:hypothetical protein